MEYGHTVLHGGMEYATPIGLPYRGPYYPCNEYTYNMKVIKTYYSPITNSNTIRSKLSVFHMKPIMYRANTRGRGDILLSVTNATVAADS